MIRRAAGGSLGQVRLGQMREQVDEEMDPDSKDPRGVSTAGSTKVFASDIARAANSANRCSDLTEAGDRRARSSSKTVGMRSLAIVRTRSLLVPEGEEPAG